MFEYTPMTSPVSQEGSKTSEEEIVWYKFGVAIHPSIPEVHSKETEVGSQLCCEKNWVDMVCEASGPKVEPFINTSSAFNTGSIGVADELWLIFLDLTWVSDLIAASLALFPHGL
uniref:Uncharacterized protein n=1 Tax=Photinus pyralis TaxID=7054 RepID=A0A1Y1LYX4_PHOPY